MSRSAFIKPEPNDFGGTASYMNFNTNQGQSMYQNGSVNPSDLSTMNENMNQPYSMGGTTNMSSSFMGGGNSFIEDDDLMGTFDSQNFNFPSNNIQQFNHVPQHMNNMYSHTPADMPIQSPFVAGGFDFNQYRPMSSIPQHMSPQPTQTFMQKRPSMQTVRKSSGPMTPRTQAMNNLHIGTPNPNNMATSQPIQTSNSSHKKRMSEQFDDITGSLDESYLGSPLTSPTNVPTRTSLSSALSHKHASVPNPKIETGLSHAETQELKKKRRRASHNAVERRRRDNINERIQDLSQLVPQHRLDDDKVRKQITSSGPLSPGMAPTSVSPPNAATSLLAGGAGRRAASTAGNITIGLPIDDKDRGPNKGDILNGSVGWTRDLMWGLYQQYIQQDELMEYIQQIGGKWPFAVSDDEQRLRTEVMDAIQANTLDTFTYSRTDGSGLRVPKHTTYNGEKLTQSSLSPLSDQSNLQLSPGFRSGGSGTTSGSNHQQAHTQQTPQYWQSAGHAGISFKEEDEYGMDVND